MTDSYRILIVDDDLDILANLSDILSELGYDIITAASGQEALARLGDADSDEVQRLDLCLLDFKMPGMDGVELLEKIHERRPEVPAIMVTAYAGEDGDRRAMEAGTWKVMRKPVDVRLLIGMIGQAIVSK
ncbi:response regulator [Mariniblastus sp.]|nr:response regulator [Mariniblastus sp.]MDB4368664.1 response regulator [bacterium]MDC3223627.1 response regulator [Mariniblastus sp.]